MASKLIEEYFPKTAEYVNSEKVDNRKGHHNYVIEQKVLNLTIPLASQSNEDVNILDEEFVEYLKNLDIKR